MTWTTGAATAPRRAPSSSSGARGIVLAADVRGDAAQQAAERAPRAVLGRERAARARHRRPSRRRRRERPRRARARRRRAGRASSSCARVRARRPSPSAPPRSRSPATRWQAAAVRASAGCAAIRSGPSRRATAGPSCDGRRARAPSPPTTAARPPASTSPRLDGVARSRGRGHPPPRTTRSPGRAERARAAGSVRRSSARSMRASIGWQRYVTSVLSSALTSALERESRRSTSPEPVRPSTASQSGPVRTSSTDAQRRSSSRSGLQRGEQLVAQVVGGESVVAAVTGDGAVRVRRSRPRRAPPGTGPTGQPSVCRTSRTARPPASGRAPRARSIRVASPRVIARSRARTSTSLPCARSRPIGSAGSSRDASTSCAPSGRSSASVASAPSAAGAAHAVQIVEHEHERAVDPLEHPGHVGERGAGVVASGAARTSARSSSAGRSGRARPRIVVGVLGAGSSAPAALGLEPVRTAASSCRSPPAPRAARAGRRRPGRGGGPAGRAASAPVRSRGARRDRAHPERRDGRPVPPRPAQRRCSTTSLTWRASPSPGCRGKGAAPAYSSGRAITHTRGCAP